MNPNDTFEIKWPNHCKTCGGWGYSCYTATYHDPGGTDPCPESDDSPCKCHRCGEHGLNEDSEGPCKNCGWNYDDGAREEYTDEGSEEWY